MEKRAPGRAIVEASEGEAGARQPDAARVSFGFSKNFHPPLPSDFEEEIEMPLDPVHRVSVPAATFGQPRVPPLSERHKGLGTGQGGQLTRSALGASAYAVLDPFERARQQRSEISTKAMRTCKITRLSDLSNVNPEYDKGHQQQAVFNTALANDGAEPQGMFKELLLSDLAWATEPAAREDLDFVRDHRWTFRGATEHAERGRSYCFFVRCLLDIQRNVQMEEEGDVLSPELARACKLFVNGQCNAGRTGEMYQLLTHFICNAVVFEEWERYLKDAFLNERANTESFLVPHLEQVWFRFCRMLSMLEEIFDVLNKRFVWRHRLPKVGDVVRESMKRRCFSSEAVHKNEIIATEKCSHETIKSIKRCFCLGQFSQ